jgi:undecaprenyl-diphosphatase
LIGASFLSFKDIVIQNIEFNYLVFFAIIFSFLFSFFTVKFFLNYINRFSLKVFVLYRIIISAVLFFIIYN